VTRDDLVVTPTGLLFMNRRFPCTIGRSGITRAKREGDGATPAGIHTFVGLLYRPDRIARTQLPDWAVPIRPYDGWSDDPKDEDYNLIVRRPHRYSHERLWRADPMYDLILLTNWNWPYAVRGAGSAIFVHTWRSASHPTAGCVAMDRADLIWIAGRIRHHTRLIIRA
jgi:L,D-peptidoglycan transpeptidase YkuD (ErfK/YbiS/YcfS/YnhG family)